MVEIQIDLREYEAAVRKIRGLGEAVSRRQRKAMLRKGAIILRDAARANVPIAPEPYKTRSGEVIYPGFTKDAIDVKSLRKSPDLFVGVEKKDKTLAYWAAWLEFGALNRDGSKREGSHYMRRALASHGQKAAGQVAADATKLFERVIKKLSKQ